MRRVVLESVRCYARRYVAAVLAIVLGVGFIVVTNALASSARNGILAGLEQEYVGAEVVVDGAGPDVAARVVELAEDQGGAASVNAMTFQPVAVDDVTLVDSAAVGTVSVVPELRWQQLSTGRFPDGPGEALVDVHDAEANQVSVGDEVVVGAGADAVTALVVGTVESSTGFLGAPVYLTWRDLQQFGDALVVQNVVYGTGSMDDDATIARIDNALPEVVAHTQDEYLEQLQTRANQGVNVLAIVVLLFAGVALFVSVLVIANTFTILLAQRQRDFALLRCVGATRRQVIRAVRWEAAVLGGLAASLGVVAGAGLGYAAVAVVRRAFDSVRLGAVDLSAWWVAGAWLLGLVVTLAASLLPARRATRVGPLAALRPDYAVPARSRAGAVRITLAVAAMAGGGVLMVRAMDQHERLTMMAGGGAFFIGLLLIGPLLVPALIRAGTAAVSPLVGVPGRLAAENSARHPRRTAATAAALLVGVTLITSIVVGMASVRSTVDSEMDQQHPIDASLVATDRFTDGAVDQVAGVRGVAGTVVLDGVDASVSGGVGELPVLGVRGAADVVRGRADLLHVEPGTVLLPRDASDLETGQTVRVTAGAREVRLQVRLGEGWGHAALVHPSVLTRLGAPSARAVWVRAVPGADVDQLTSDLAAVARAADARFDAGIDDREWVDLQLDVMLGVAVGLLGISVLVALGGIGNTLGLSVLERTREIALLRALGMTRRGLRATLAAEAVAVALVAGVIGVATGTLFAWVGVETMVGTVVAEPTLVVPVGQVLAVVAVAGFAGLLACLMPARRGARIVPAAGLAAE